MCLRGRHSLDCDLLGEEEEYTTVADHTWKTLTSGQVFASEVGTHLGHLRTKFDEEIKPNSYN